MRCHRESDSNAGADASPADAEGGIGRREGRGRRANKNFATGEAGRERDATTGARAAWRDEDRGGADETARVPIPRRTDPATLIRE